MPNLMLLQGFSTTLISISNNSGSLPSWMSRVRVSSPALLAADGVRVRSPSPPMMQSHTNRRLFAFLTRCNAGTRPETWLRSYEPVQTNRCLPGLPPHGTLETCHAWIWPRVRWHSAAPCALIAIAAERSPSRAVSRPSRPGRARRPLGGGRRSVRWRRQRLVPDLAEVRTGDKLSS
jgi:hypothetical protein